MLCAERRDSLAFLCCKVQMAGPYLRPALSVNFLLVVIAFLPFGVKLSSAVRATCFTARSSLRPALVSLILTFAFLSLENVC